jgi:hypothetical protein
VVSAVHRGDGGASALVALKFVPSKSGCWDQELSCLDEATVSESILTGRHFLGCAACGTYCRHNGVVQALHDFFRLEMCFSGRTLSPGPRNVPVGSSYVRRQGNSDRYTDGQVWGSPHTGAKIAFDVGIVEPNLNSHSARSGCSQSFLNVNAGTRDEEREKVKRYKVLCNQRGLTFVLIVFTTSGGMGEAFQRQVWHPHWKRVEAEDAEMKISGVGLQEEEVDVDGDIWS